MKSNRSFLAIAPAVLMAMVLVGCGLLNPLGSAGNPYIPGTEGQKEVRVQVLDATTMEPIAGAIVVGGYNGFSNSGGSRGIACVKSESAVSDENGWAILPNDQDERIGERKPRLWGPELISAYKRGYQLAKPIDRVSGDGVNCRIVKIKPKPLMDPYADGDFLSDQIVPCPQNEAQLKTKERGRIYLMPSTATTNEERWIELTWQRGLCGYPFPWSNSKGGGAYIKAVYKELLEIGYTEKQLQNIKEAIDRYEKDWQEREEKRKEY